MLNTDFNLLDDPWIPVLTPEGAEKEISLIELFKNAHTYLGFNASPVDSGVFIRLTAAIVLRVREWEESWEAGQFTEAHVAYLEGFRDAFRLGCFFQEEDLATKIGADLTIVPVSTLFKINPLRQRGHPRSSTPHRGGSGQGTPARKHLRPRR